MFHKFDGDGLCDVKESFVLSQRWAIFTCGTWHHRAGHVNGQSTGDLFSHLAQALSYYSMSLLSYLMHRP
jgi:hypothetical protein